MQANTLLPWQAEPWSALTARAQQAHAYLLHGPVGSGKGLLAERFAHWLLCKQPTPDAGCGHCSACMLYAADTHPDLFRIHPEEPGKGILIGHVRHLVGRIQQTAQQGGRKVIIVQPAEVMTIESANALLKSLEEPGPDTVFLMVTDQLSFLLPTIKSRCVLQACPLPSEELAQQWLAGELVDLGPADQQLLLALAAGSPLRAVQLAGEGILQTRHDVVEGVKQLLKHQVSAVELAQRWAKIPPVTLLEWFAQWCQAILRYQLTQQDSALGLQDMQAVLRHMAKYVQSEAVFTLHGWVIERRLKLLKRAPLRSDLILESLLVQWVALVR